MIKNHFLTFTTSFELLEHVLISLFDSVGLKSVGENFSLIFKGSNFRIFSGCCFLLAIFFCGCKSDVVETICESLVWFLKTLFNLAISGKVELATEDDVGGQFMSGWFGRRIADASWARSWIGHAIRATAAAVWLARNWGLNMDVSGEGFDGLKQLKMSKFGGDCDEFSSCFNLRFRAISSISEKKSV